MQVRLDREMADAVKEHAGALAEATGKPLGVSAALREIIWRGLKAYCSKAERESYARGVKEGWLAAKNEIKRKLVRASAEEGDSG